ncbi:MAG: DUF4410 domain-containing protein [Thermodesulfobacteriota bacterium]|nr:DUF4410 domain-containing protein [Thermodesulfobacteriota bacterium]
MSVFLAGCAVGYTRVLKIPESNFSKYQVIEIPDLEGSSQIPIEIKKGIPDEIAKELTGQNVFAKIARSPIETNESILLLKGKIIQYNPGSRGMRWLTGPLWGVGKGSVIVNIEFIEKESGKKLAESRFEGEIKGGFFGGGIEETHAKIANEISQFVKSNL